MKTKKLRILSLMLCLALAFSALAPAALAADDGTSDSDPGEPMRYTYTATIGAGLSIDSSGYATCVATAKLYSSSNIANVTMELERSSNGTSGWSTVKTWSASGYGGVSFERHRYVSHGYYYRVYVGLDVTDSSGTTLETIGKVSSVVYY